MTWYRSATQPWDSVRPLQVWDALSAATWSDDLTSEDGDSTATHACTDAMFIEDSPVIVTALTAAGVTCHDDGTPETASPQREAPAAAAPATSL